MLEELEAERIYDKLGGRLSLLSKVAKREDMDKAADDMIINERGWLLHKLGLIPGASHSTLLAIIY